MKRQNKRKLLFSTHHGSPWCCAWHERAGIHQAPGILAAGAALAAGGGRHDDGVPLHAGEDTVGDDRNVVADGVDGSALADWKRTLNR